MKILITGGTGLLGQALLASRPGGIDIVATRHTHRPDRNAGTEYVPLDLRDAAGTYGLVASLRPDLVIHTASVGSVDQAEREPDEVRRINVGGLEAIGGACGDIGAKLVFISSNAVFDGRHPPYDENAPRRSVNKYGALKIEAEEWLERSGLTYAIFRPILLYGWPIPGGRSNVVTRWLELLDDGRTVDVAGDIFSMPLYAPNAADAIWSGIGKGVTGTFHLAGADRMSLAEFARRVARAFGYDERLVRAVPAASFAGLAPRPLDTCFVITKMSRDLETRPVGVDEGLAAMHSTRVLSSR